MPLAHRVLEFFHEHLAEVAFPDVSAAILEAQVARYDERQAALGAARAQLRQAESELDAARSELAQLAERALAYAHVYVSGETHLEERLERLQPPKPARVKPRSKSKGGDAVGKSTAAQTSLPAPAPPPTAARSEPAVLDRTGTG